MGSCVAFNCTNRCSKKIPGLTFHSFPKNETRRQLWVKAVRRENWEPSKFSKLCSKHFPEEMIDRTSLSCVRLRDNAVPSLFDFPSHLQKVVKLRKLPTRAVFEPAHSKIVQQATTGVESAATELEVLGCSSESPTKAVYKRKVAELGDIIEKKNKKLKVLQQKVRRYEKKVKNLSELLAHLKKKDFLDDDALHVLSTVTSVNKEFISRQLATVTKLPLPQNYSAELRSFALTLNFYSPRAYEYVRSTFGLALPHHKTLSRWYQHIDAAPGFTKEAIDALALKIRNSPNPLFFSLIMDEMSIRQQAEFDGKEVHGLINLGFDETDDDSLPLAKEAFVLLLVCINSHWKLPIGYFLSNGLSSTQKQTLIKHCLSLLHQNNVNVVSLTFDGLSNNFSMAKQLGCNFDDVNSLKTCFPHPSDSNQEIAVFPDPPHMLNLVRNTFGEKRCLFSSEIIDWKYVEALHKLQESEGVHLGNKLRGGHIKFSKQKMKVKLAAQLFSSSVADAIDYCHNKLKLQDFIGSEATVEFLRLINTLFDVLNSRSIRQHGYKKAVSKQNADLYLQFMHKAKAYIQGVQQRTP
ncbi:DNA transposase THAP9 [Araneus ventricosus]|uniref:DNA transposase THAP9 n=1 Tax=Araneus ventricosus TaxID=182803 RepID=A0A4Y2CAR7_ARAVE|nr:DNA transposase THAP9 [Araneus ventricosus]